VLRRARTAAALPARVVACEDRCTALENDVGARLVEMRGELAEIRSLLTSKLEADADTAELVGRLLRSAETRLVALEDRAELPELPRGREERAAEQ
jgi:hypothetical protein